MLYKKNISFFVRVYINNNNSVRFALMVANNMFQV